MRFRWWEEGFVSRVEDFKFEGKVSRDRRYVLFFFRDLEEMLVVR